MDALINHFDTYLETSLLLAALVAYLAGLLASLTPCVYPMIPITAGIIAGANVGGSSGRGFLLSLVYTIGLALMYAGLGVFAAASGGFFGTVTTNPWIMLGVGNLLLVFGLSMLDVFHFPLLAPKGQKTGGGLAGVFVAGMISALVAGPCTVPVLGGMLTYVATTGDLFRGGLLLFVFAFGMGTILLAAGTFSGLLTSLPKSGRWMNRVKLFLGLMLIGIAEYFIFKAGTLLL